MDTYDKVWVLIFRLIQYYYYVGTYYYIISPCFPTRVVCYYYVQKKKKETADKCVTSSSEVNESEKVQLDKSIGDKSVTPESMISDSNGPETRLQSKISELELKLKNLSLQEEC